ncbi:unnamed protein product [Closterium sp. NIES-53]
MFSRALPTSSPPLPSPPPVELEPEQYCFSKSDSDCQSRGVPPPPLLTHHSLTPHLRASSFLPLTLHPPPVPASPSPQPVELDPALYGFSEADLDRQFFLGIWRMSGFLSENRPVQTLREILARLEQTYCGTVGYEYMHIADREQCNWLRDKIETPTKRKYGKQRRQVRRGGGGGRWVVGGWGFSKKFPSEKGLRG